MLYQANNAWIEERRRKAVRGLQFSPFSTRRSAKALASPFGIRGEAKSDSVALASPRASGGSHSNKGASGLAAGYRRGTENTERKILKLDINPKYLYLFYFVIIQKKYFL